MKKKAQDQLNSAMASATPLVKTNSSGGTAPSMSSSNLSRSASPKLAGVLEKEVAKLFFQIKRSEAAGTPIAAELNEKAQSLKQELKNQSIEFYGLISKCWISGNDCHLLDMDLEIVQHFKASDLIPEGFSKVRHLIAGLDPQVMGLLVYSHQVLVLYMDGSIQLLEVSNA